jgi:Flp pilus assembly protein TadG
MFIQKLKLIQKNQKGQAMVEMALLLPLLLVIIFGIMEFGRIFNAYLVITNASREGVRQGVVGMTDSQITTSVKTAAGNLDLSSLSVTITPNSASRVRGAELKVVVNYSVDIYTPVISNIIGDPFPISAQTVMRVE